VHIRRDDTVVAISGKHAGSGKTGKVLQVYPERQVALVEGFNLVKKALRKSEDNPQGGIGEEEGPIAVSNLLIYCPTCKKGVKTGASGKKESARKCKKCGHEF
jgi:large subunit ribosomal protein L24